MGDNTFILRVCSRVFLEFHYLRVSINTYKGNWRYSESFLPCSVDIDNLPNHIKSMSFSFRLESLHENQHLHFSFFLRRNEA